MEKEISTQQNAAPVSAPKRKKAINTLVIIFAIVCAACLMTWIIPAGQYKRGTSPTGIKMVDASSFQWVANSPVNPIDIPMYITQGAAKSIDLLFMLLVSGAAFTVVVKSGAMHSSVGAVALKYRERKTLFVLAMLALFAALCTTHGLIQFVAFVPVMVMICLALGLDSITALGIMTGGCAVGFATGMLSPSTTLIAQNLAELPPYSGIEYRAVCFAAYLVLTAILLVRYTRKITKNPELSPTYDLDKENPLCDPEAINAFGPMTLRKWLVLLSTVAALVLMVYGSVNWKWGYNHLSAGFIGLAVVAGACAGMSPSTIANNFVDGAKSMVLVFFLVASARAISAILGAGKVLDTIVYGLGVGLQMVPSWLQGIAMFVANLLINTVIPSGSGQASAVMPIMLPLADLIGMTRQTAILAFNFGDGFCNWVIPTSSALMAVLGMAKVPFDRWMRYIWHVFMWWFALGCVLIVIAQMIHYGPF